MEKGFSHAILLNKKDSFQDFVDYWGTDDIIKATSIPYVSGKKGVIARRTSTIKQKPIRYYELGIYGNWKVCTKPSGVVFYTQKMDCWDGRQTEKDYGIKLYRTDTPDPNWIEFESNKEKTPNYKVLEAHSIWINTINILNKDQKNFLEGANSHRLTLPFKTYTQFYGTLATTEIDNVLLSQINDLFNKCPLLEAMEPTNTNKKIIGDYIDSNLNR